MSLAAPTAPSARWRVRQWLDPESGTRASRWVDIAVMLLIVANIAAIMLETEETILARYAAAFDRFELFSVAVFTVEYVLRLWVAVEDGRYRSPLTGRLRYAMTPMALVDLAAILPFYLSGFFDSDGRILRVLRLLRIFKLTRYSSPVEIFFTVIGKELPVLLSAIFVMFIFMILASAGIYLLERNTQPEAFGSIPRAMWWAAVTLTTVGYGDVVPATVAGRMLGVMITVLGVGMAALPAGIIAAGFSNELARRRQAYRVTVREMLDKSVLEPQVQDRLEAERSTLGLSETEAALLEKDERTARARRARQY